MTPNREDVVRLHFSPDLDVQAGAVLGDYVEERREVFERVTGWDLGPRLGCGFWGCAFATSAPWVVKVTRDATEGPIWAFIRESYEARPDEMAGFPRVDDVMRLRPDVSVAIEALGEEASEPSPVYAVRREAIDPMFTLTTRRDALRMTQRTADELGLMAPMSYEDMKMDRRPALVEFKQAIKHLLAYKARSREIQGEEIMSRPDRMVIRELESETLKHLAVLAQHPLFSDLAASLYGMAGLGVYFADLHPGNIGWRIHADIEGDVRPLTAVVTDPGVASTPYDVSVREALLRNRSRRWPRGLAP